MARFLFLGIGNPDRGDDGVGPLIANKLADHHNLKMSGVEVRQHFGEGSSLMELWEGTTLTVAVDAMKSGRDVGAVLRVDAVADKLPSGMFHYSSHLFGLAEAVEMSRMLGSLPKSLIVYGIEGGNFKFGAALSTEVEKAMEEVERSVAGDFQRPGSV